MATSLRTAVELHGSPECFDVLATIPLCFLRPESRLNLASQCFPLSIIHGGGIASATNPIAVRVDELPSCVNREDKISRERTQLLEFDAGNFTFDSGL